MSIFDYHRYEYRQSEYNQLEYSQSGHSGSESEKLSKEIWVSIDFHVHSTYSGGSLSPAEILFFSQERLLDAVAISDHHEVQGSLEGQEITSTHCELPIMVTSQEVSAGDHFHLLLVGSKSAIPEIKRKKLPETLHAHRESGGAVILAHPWSLPRWGKDELTFLLTEGLIDGIELFNSSILERSRETQAFLEYCWNEWVIPYQLAVVGGSDYHYLNRGRVIGGGRTYLKVGFPDELGIIEALRSRRAVAGLFGCQNLSMDWIGSGPVLFLGQEPWLGEVKLLQEYLKSFISQYYKENLVVKKFLNHLLENGNFQHLIQLFN